MVLWLAAAISLAAVVMGIGSLGADRSGIQWVLMIPVFIVSGALIISRQPTNVIGWILMAPGMAMMFSNAIDANGGLVQPPEAVTWTTLLSIWLNNLGWIFLIYPIFHLLLVFPTGRLLSRRWRWLVWLEVTMVAGLGLLSALADQVGPEEVPEPWVIDNPIGVLSSRIFDSPWFGVTWTIALLIVTLGAVSAVVVRYRRATRVEKQQFKWLMIAVVFFGVIYGLTAISEGGFGAGIGEALFVLAIASIPIAIAVSVLRYRLFDIDYFIRRTIIYALVVAVLGGLFAGSITVLTLFLPSDDPLVIAGSTLLAAALFNPIRVRVRDWIDRRFNRSRFSNQRVMDEFTGTLRDRIEVDSLMAGWTGVIETTMEPSALGVWTKP